MPGPCNRRLCGLPAIKINVVILIAATLLTACTKYEPIVDLKASKNPGEFQTDWQQCESLSEKYDLGHGGETACLKGRGHNVLGERKL